MISYKNFEYVKDLLYESTSRKVLAPAVSCDFYGPKTKHSHVDSESEVYGNFIRSVRAKFMEFYQIQLSVDGCWEMKIWLYQKLIQICERLGFWQYILKFIIP